MLKTFLRTHYKFLLLSLFALPWIYYSANVVWDVTVGDQSQHMQYAWLIPVLSGVLLYFRREAIREAIQDVRPALGMAMSTLLFALIFLFFGIRGEQPRFVLVALILVLWVLPLACYGRKLFSVVWFPIALLIFLTPVEFLDDMTGPMRRFSAQTTALLLNGLGIESECRGTAIFGVSSLHPFKLEVEDPCSGIRSIVALFVGTAAYGAYLLKGIKNRWLLFFSSFPIAFLGNVIRLLLTAIVAYWWGQEAGMRLHDNALFIIAPVYVVCVFKLTDWLRNCEENAKKSSSKTEDVVVDNDTQKTEPIVETLTTSTSSSTKRSFLWLKNSVLVVIGGLLLGGWIWATQTSKPELEADTFIVQELQPIEGATLYHLVYCYDVKCQHVMRYRHKTPRPEKCEVCQSADLHSHSLAEHNILPQDTRILRAIYDFGAEGEYTISVVVAGHSRTSIHRPELCLPSQGKVFDSSIKEILPDVPMVCGELRSSENEVLSSGGFAYVYLNSKGATVSDFERVVGDTFERAWHNTIPRWAMMTVSSDVNFKTPEGEALLKEKMKLFYKMVRKDR